MKICFTGSIGVGKTTLVEALQNHSLFREKFKFFPSVSSLCAVKPHEDQLKHNQQRQDKLDEIYIRNFDVDAVIDRYYTDRLAWELLWPTPEIHTDLVLSAVQGIEDTKSRVILFYLPAYEFEFKGDPKSPMRDPERRRIMDESIHDLLRAFRIPFLTCHGTVAERVDQIVKVYERMVHAPSSFNVL